MNKRRDETMFSLDINVTIDENGLYHGQCFIQTVFIFVIPINTSRFSYFDPKNAAKRQVAVLNIPTGLKKCTQKPKATKSLEDRRLERLIRSHPYAGQFDSTGIRGYI